MQYDSHAEPLIMVRKHAVLIALSPLLAIVTADRVILSVPDGADSLLHILQDLLLGESSRVESCPIALLVASITD